MKIHRKDLFSSLFSDTTSIEATEISSEVPASSTVSDAVTSSEVAPITSSAIPAESSLSSAPISSVWPESSTPIDSEVLSTSASTVESGSSEILPSSSSTDALLFPTDSSSSDLASASTTDSAAIAASETSAVFTSASETSSESAATSGTIPLSSESAAVILSTTATDSSSSLLSSTGVWDQFTSSTETAAASSLPLSGFSTTSAESAAATASDAIVTSSESSLASAIIASSSDVWELSSELTSDVLTNIQSAYSSLGSVLTSQRGSTTIVSSESVPDSAAVITDSLSTTSSAVLFSSAPAQASSSPTGFVSSSVAFASSSPLPSASSSSGSSVPESVVLYSPTSGSFVATTIPLSSALALSSAAQATATGKQSTTSNWVPSSIEFETSTAGDPTGSASSSPSASSSSSPQLPNAIAPSTQVPISENYTVITIGFKSGLNYPFVVQHSLASAQIFQYLPKALTYPISDDSDVQVKQLVPFQSPSLNYIVTIAEVYYPKDWVSALNQSLQTTYSKFYFNPNPTENSLAQLIDVNIPLIGLESSSTSSSLSSSSSSGSSENEGQNGLSSSSSGSFDAVQDPNTKANNKLGVVGTTSGVSAAVYISVLLVGFKMYKQRKGSLPFSTEETGNIVLPIADDADEDDESVRAAALAKMQEEQAQVKFNPVYSEATLERRMSYQSFKSYMTGSGAESQYDGGNDLVDQLTINEEDEDEYNQSGSDMEEVDQIIPHISYPSQDNWI